MPWGVEMGVEMATLFHPTEGPRLLGLDTGDDEHGIDGCIIPRQVRTTLLAHLPPALAIRDWRLIYSTEQHGCSLRTAYHRLARSGPTMLAVLDTRGHCFGCFASEPWAPAHRYFGTGESFLFKASPTFEVYPWTGANAHFQLAKHDSLAMGGGGHFGLWLDEAFEYGSTGCSETYANPPLSSEESFRILRVEFWELVATLASPTAAHGYAAAGDQSDESIVGSARSTEPVMEKAMRQGSSAMLAAMLSTTTRRL